MTGYERGIFNTLVHKQGWGEVLHFAKYMIEYTKGYCIMLSEKLQLNNCILLLNCFTESQLFWNACTDIQKWPL